MSFCTSVYIDSDEMTSLDNRTECLRCILESADIEVEVEIDFDYTPGYSGNWENPPEDAVAEYTNINVTNMSFSAGDDLVEENIKVLITKEQKEAIRYLTELIIDRDWGKKYEQEAFDSLPEPDDYY